MAENLTQVSKSSPVSILLKIETFFILAFELRRCFCEAFLEYRFVNTIVKCDLVKITWWVALECDVRNIL